MTRALHLGDGNYAEWSGGQLRLTVRDPEGDPAGELVAEILLEPEEVLRLVRFLTPMDPSAMTRALGAICGAQSVGCFVYCTRPRGHDGMHQARSLEGDLVAEFAPKEGDKP